MTLDIRDSDAGAIVLVIAKPGAKKNDIVGVHASALKVAVTAAPEKGKANKAIVKLLAKRLGVSPSSIDIVSGDVSKQKKVRVSGLRARDVVDRLGLGGIA